MFFLKCYFVFPANYFSNFLRQKLIRYVVEREVVRVLCPAEIYGEESKIFLK